MSTIPKHIPSFRKEFIQSLIFHVVILLAFVVRGWFAPEPIDFSSAIRVDMVGLPQKMQELQTEAELSKELAIPKAIEKAAPEKQSAKSKKEVTKKDAINLKKHEKVNDQQKSAIEKLKALEKLEQEEKNATSKKAKKTQVAGNMVSPGNSLHGVQRLQFDSYLSDIDQHVKKYWELPKWLSNLNLRARVLVLIDARGNVVRRQIMQSSGNPTYDSMALQAVDQASPFPAPQGKFIEILSNQGMLLGFPD